MTTQIIKESKKKGFTVTEFFDGKGLKYQITQRYDKDFTNKNDEYKHIFGFVCLTKEHIQYILKQIEKEDKKDE